MIKINLLKPEKKDFKEAPAVPTQEARAKARPQLGNLVLVLIVIGVAALYFYQKRAIDRENTQLAAAQEEKGKLQYVIAKLDQLQKQKESFVKKVNLINLLKEQRGLAVRIMDELSRNLPDWVWLNQVTFDNMSVQISGDAISNNLIADYIASLERSPVFSNVNLIASTQRTAGNDQFLEFSLTASCVLQKEQKPKEGAPQAASKGGVQ